MGDSPSLRARSTPTNDGSRDPGSIERRVQRRIPERRGLTVTRTVDPTVAAHNTRSSGQRIQTRSPSLRTQRLEVPSTSGQKPANTACRRREEKSGGQQKAMPTTEPEKLNPGAQPTHTHRCDVCGEVFTSLSKLAKHSLARTCQDRGKCAYCEVRFETFNGVKLHERKAHPEHYVAEREQYAPTPDAEIFRRMAEFEASYEGTCIRRDMAEAVGLTRDKVRYRRQKPEYARYLEIARRNPGPRDGGAAPAFSPLARPTASVHTRNSPEPLHAIRAGTTPTGAITATAVQGETVPSSNELALQATPKDLHRQKESASQGDEVHTGRVLRSRCVVTTRPMVSQQPAGQSSTNVPATSLPKRELGRRRAKTPAPPQPVARVLRPRNPRAPAVAPAPIRPVDGTVSADASPGKSDRHPVNVVVAPLRGSPVVAPLRSPSPVRASDMPRSFVEHIENMRAKLQAGSGPLDRVLECGLRGSDAELEFALEDWQRTLVGFRPHSSRPRKPRENPREHQRHYGATTGGKGNRAAEYKKAQQLYGKNRSALAEIVFTGKRMYDDPVLPTVEDVEALFGGILESPSPEDNEPIADRRQSEGTFLPISEADIRAGTSGWQHSAPGLDGITVEGVKKLRPAILSAVFSIILGRNVHPPSWRTSRTVLVPKDGDRKEAGNWRPISIGSAVQRLLHRILHSRLRSSMRGSVHQRGFAEVDGTLANVLILDHYIGRRLEAGRGYNVVSLDLRKAFDSVSQESVLRALERMGVDQGTVAYVASSLKGCTTVIQVGDKTTRKLNIRRGVKQGDPLSPLLFNIVLDELLVQMNDKYRGGALEDDQRVTLMGFADDLILLSDRQLEVPLILDDLFRFLGKRGMAINPKKCAALSASTSRGEKVPLPVAKSIFNIGGESIPAVSAVSAFKYLGHQFGATGIRQPSVPKLEFWLRNVERAPLKPDQKSNLIRTYLIPRLTYGLQTTKTTGVVLRGCDRLIKASVKRCLHLPKTTPDCVLHAKVRDGGLGFQQLRRTVPATLHKRMVGLRSKTEDPIIHVLMQSERVKSIMARMMKLAGDIPPDQLWREAISNGPLTSGVQSAVEDTSSREWVLNRPTGWSGRDFVRAVHLRSNTLPVKGHPSVPLGERGCRYLGCNAMETVSHVLQACPAVHGERIHRHDDIVKRVAAHCRSRWTVEVEPHVRHQDGRLYKPDLVIHQSNDVSVVCDVQISWEGANGLGDAWMRKREVYGNAHFIEAAKKRWPAKTLFFLPLIIGARGIWPRCNAPTVEALGLTQPFRASCVHSVLKWGSTLHGSFMRRVWASAHGPPRQGIAPRDRA